MEFSGIQTISVPIEKVWAYLVDMKKVAACGPGFQSLEDTRRRTEPGRVSRAPP